MKRFFSVVGAFIIATGTSCALFTGLSFADTLTDPTDGDQTDINDSEQGNAPMLTYVGEEQYDQIEGVDFYQLIQATDKEDSDIVISEANTNYELTENTDDEVNAREGYQAYTLHYEVTDSDGNTSGLTCVIYVKVASDDDPSPAPDSGEGDEENKKDDDGGNEGGENGGNDNEGGDPDNTDPDPTQPDNPNNPDEPGDKQDPAQPDNPNNPDDQDPGNSDPDDNTPGTNPGSSDPVNPDTPINPEEPDNPAGPGENNDGDNSDTPNAPDSPSIPDAPVIPGSTNQTDSEKPNGSTNSSNSDLPLTLPNTGGSSIFNQIPRTLLYSLIFGFIVASIVYYRTDRTSASRKSVR